MDSGALDRYITGNYGEDFLDGDESDVYSVGDKVIFHKDSDTVGRISEVHTDDDGPLYAVDFGTRPQYYFRGYELEPVD